MSRKKSQSLDAFLASVQKRAFYQAQFATKNVDDALDLVQEAMFTLAKSYADKPVDEWPPLFHRILQNKIMDWHRRRKVRQLFLMAQPEDTDSVEDDVKDGGPLGVLEDEQLKELVLAQVGALPLKQQQTFLLRHWWGYSVKEVAGILGCSEGTVKTHFFRATEKLKLNTKLQEVVGREKSIQ